MCFFRISGKEHCGGGQAYRPYTSPDCRPSGQPGRVHRETALEIPDDGGAEGVGLSRGQEQRIFIARALYKDPSFVFLDEATNSLDANNERIITGNLLDFCKGRTVLIVAHRLSTIRHADKIVVLHKGRIVEEGTHDELCARHGHYYELINNQLIAMG